MRGTHFEKAHTTKNNLSGVDLNCVTLCTTLHRNVFSKVRCVYLIENGKIGKSMAEHRQLLLNLKLWSHNGTIATNDNRHVCKKYQKSLLQYPNDRSITCNVYTVHTVSSSIYECNQCRNTLCAYQCNLPNPLHCTCSKNIMYCRQHQKHFIDLWGT
jgi:hypothetical protein